jgi:hypothetical protein
VAAHAALNRQYAQSSMVIGFPSAAELQYPHSFTRPGRD